MFRCWNFFCSDLVPNLFVLWSWVVNGSLCWYLRNKYEGVVLLNLWIDSAHIFVLILCGICSEMAVEIGSAYWNCSALRLISSAGMVLRNCTWWDPSWFRAPSLSNDDVSSAESSESDNNCWSICCAVSCCWQLLPGLVVVDARWAERPELVPFDCLCPYYDV